jgi:hypothetical protein
MEDLGEQLVARDPVLKSQEEKLKLIPALERELRIAMQTIQQQTSIIQSTKVNEDKMKVECESLTKKINKMRSQITSLNGQIYDQQLLLLHRKDETIRQSGKYIRDMKYEMTETNAGIISLEQIKKGKAFKIEGTLRKHCDPEPDTCAVKSVASRRECLVKDIEREERKDEGRTIEAVDLVNKFSYLESVSNVLEPFFTERECEMVWNNSNLRFYDEPFGSFFCLDLPWSSSEEDCNIDRGITLDLILYPVVRCPHLIDCGEVFSW